MSTVLEGWNNAGCDLPMKIMVRSAYQIRDRARAHRTVRILVALVLLTCSAACSHLEPRWLLQRLPGDYPEVVYFFPTDQKLIALTIDDGPDPAATNAIVDFLDRYGAKATFFFVTDNIPGNEALVEQAVAAGHELGNHMTVDEVSSDLSQEEFERKIAQAHRVLTRYGPVRWFRPGSAWYNQHMLDTLADYGYRMAEASMLPLDARIPSPKVMAAYINATVKAGSIIVLHTRQNRGTRTLATLRRIVPELEARGYRFVTLSELDRHVRRAASGEAEAFTLR